MHRVLIALQGGRIGRSALDAAFNYCQEVRMDVDLVRVDGGDELPGGLTEFLGRPRGNRLNCRVFQRQGPMSRAVQQHAGEHKGIHVILVDDLKHWGNGIPPRALSQPVGLLSCVTAT